MANKNFIKSVYDQAGGKPRSVEWYRKKIKEFTLPSSGQLVREGKRTKRPTPGVLNMFFYDPKTKGKLPYYDTFPLVLPIEEYNNGFLGLNFHYLSIPFRVKLLDKMMDYANDNEINEKTRLRVDYRNLKNINLVKPTLKRYLTNQTYKLNIELFMLKSFDCRLNQVLDGSISFPINMLPERFWSEALNNKLNHNQLSRLLEVIPRHTTEFLKKTIKPRLVNQKNNVASRVA